MVIIKQMRVVLYSFIYEPSSGRPCAKLARRLRDSGFWINQCLRYHELGHTAQEEKKNNRKKRQIKKRKKNKKKRKERKRKIEKERKSKDMKKNKIKLKKITADKRKKTEKYWKEKKGKEKKRKEKERKEKKRNEKKRKEKTRKESQNKSKKERNLRKKASKRKKKRVLKHLGKGSETGLKPVKTFSLRIFLGSMVQATLVTRHEPVTSGLQTQSLCQALVCIIAQGVLLLHAPRIKSCFGSIPCLLFLKMCLLLCSVLGPRRRGPWFLTS